MFVAGLITALLIGVVVVLGLIYMTGVLDKFLPDNLKRHKPAAPISVVIISPYAEMQKTDDMLKALDLPPINEMLAGDLRDQLKTIDPVTVLDAALDCAVKPIAGDQCPNGYHAVLRSCIEGYCCKLDADEVVDTLKNATGIPTSMAVSIGFEIVFSVFISLLASKTTSQILVNMVAKTAAKTVAKITGKMSIMISKAAAGPVGWVLAAADTVNLLIDIYDPKGYNQFGTNVAFRATRDRLEQMFVAELKTVMPGPPFLFPWTNVLTKQVKGADGADSSVLVQAIFTEVATSLKWLEEKEPAKFQKVIDAANAGAIKVQSGNMCGDVTDACSVHTNADACTKDSSESCVFAGTNCVNSNFLEGALAMVPLGVRDAHFFEAVKVVDVESSTLISVFDRNKHSWFVGMKEIPYAITLTEKGRDKVNTERATPDAPMALITKHYRDIGVGTWKNAEKNIDAEGIAEVPVNDKTPFTSVEDIPRMADKTIPEPLCLITMGEILRAICEDPKKGGIENVGALWEKEGAAPQNTEGLKRDDLDPSKYGVKFNWDNFTCQYTNAYCDRAGLNAFTNEFGDMDCRMLEGQGWAEMIFGTTVTREVIETFESLGETLESLLNPKNFKSVDDGGDCKVLTQCKGHVDNQVDELTMCCPKTKEDGQAIRDAMLAGAALSIINPIALVTATLSQSRIPRTCQKMQWTRSIAPVAYCPFDAANPRLAGAPLEDGALCGESTTCERCTAAYHEFWYSKGFTACGTEPLWTDGLTCGPGTTCKKCANGSAAWDDGGYRCGPRVAGTTQTVGESCAYDTHCVAHTDANEGARTKCCNKRCTVAQKGDSPGVWWCPGSKISSVTVGGACNTDLACIGNTAINDKTSCCSGTCMVMEKINGGLYCPNKENKPVQEGSVAPGDACTSGRNCRGFTAYENKAGCCETADGAKTCQPLENISGIFYCPNDKPIEPGSILPGAACKARDNCIGHTATDNPAGCCEVEWTDKNNKTCQTKVKKNGWWWCPQDPEISRKGIGEGCIRDQNCNAHTDDAVGTRTMCCDNKCALADKGATPGAWWCPGGETNSVSVGGACRRSLACIGNAAIRDKTGCCEGTCQVMTVLQGVAYCPNDPNIRCSNWAASRCPLGRCTNTGTNCAEKGDACEEGFAKDLAGSCIAQLCTNYSRQATCPARCLWTGAGCLPAGSNCVAGYTKNNDHGINV